MALLHDATLSPSKIEILTRWLPSQPWFGASTDVQQLGAYRFDDPAGEVGIEAFLLATDAGALLHVPLTYRSAPLAGAEEYLVGTGEHSVLGRRWFYDGCADPIWATALATTVLTGGTQVEVFIDRGAGLERLEPTATVSGSGAPGTPVPAIEKVTCRDDGRTTVIRAGEFELVVVREVGAEVPTAQTLTGHWPGGGPAVLAGVRPV
jgi:hypothetical protein